MASHNDKRHFACLNLPARNIFFAIDLNVVPLISTMGDSSTLYSWKSRRTGVLKGVGYFRTGVKFPWV